MLRTSADWEVGDTAGGDACATRVGGAAPAEIAFAKPGRLA